MSKKGSAYHCPPKRLVIPPDYAPLENHGRVLVAMIRATFQHRMNEANKRK